MTIKEKKMAMAFAIGKATLGEDNSGEHVTINLGELNENWKDYKLTGFGGKICKTYNLVYEGKFGDQKVCSRLISIYHGWSINHIASLILQVIEWHQTELAKEKAE